MYHELELAVNVGTESNYVPLKLSLSHKVPVLPSTLTKSDAKELPTSQFILRMGRDVVCFFLRLRLEIYISLFRDFFFFEVDNIYDQQLAKTPFSFPGFSIVCVK